jgi:Rieske 2Fe-2S family protein
VSKLVCPYHAWVYGRDGRLRSAPHMPEGFNPADYGLYRCPVRVVEGLVFVCLGDDPPDFEPTAREIEQLFKPHRFDQAKVCHRATYHLRCNWKIAGENTWECYHCTHTHPEYCSVMTYATAFDSPRKQAERDAQQRESEARARGLGHPVVDRSAPRDPAHFVNQVPIRPGYVTQSQDGQPVAPLMGDFKAYDGRLAGFMTYPIIWFAASNDHALLVRFTPHGPVDTEVEYAWLVHAGAVEGVDYDVGRVTWLWRTTAEQDQTICENNQAGVQSRRYQPGPYAVVEGAADQFIRWYLRCMRQGPGNA